MPTIRYQGYDEPLPPPATVTMGWYIDQPQKLRRKKLVLQRLSPIGLQPAAATISHSQRIVLKKKKIRQPEQNDSPLGIAALNPIATNGWQFTFDVIPSRRKSPKVKADEALPFVGTLTVSGWQFDDQFTPRRKPTRKQLDDPTLFTIAYVAPTVFPEGWQDEQGVSRRLRKRSTAVDDLLLYPIALVSVPLNWWDDVQGRQQTRKRTSKPNEDQLNTALDVLAVFAGWEHQQPAPTRKRRKNPLTVLDEPFAPQQIFVGWDFVDQTPTVVTRRKLRRVIDDTPLRDSPKPIWFDNDELVKIGRSKKRQQVRDDQLLFEIIVSGIVVDRLRSMAHNYFTPGSVRSNLFSPGSEQGWSF